MTSSLAQPSAWPRRRWWSLVALIFGLQLGIIFWLGENTPARQRQANPAPLLRMAGQAYGEALALVDPTLFALPHQQTFSGPAWMSAPTQDFHPFVWSEPPRWLRLGSEQLGAAFQQFITTNEATPLLALGQPEPELRLPSLPPANDFPTRSTFRVTGQLAQRRLVKSFELPSWPAAEILTNSRVQMVVDELGKPVSVILLYPGSGLKDADTNALWLATLARFEPVAGAGPAAANPSSGLSWGQIIFDWHTLPMALTNTQSEGKK
jgi:hypothetical protein